MRESRAISFDLFSLFSFFPKHPLRTPHEREQVGVDAKADPRARLVTRTGAWRLADRVARLGLGSTPYLERSAPGLGSRSSVASKTGISKAAGDPRQKKRPLTSARES